MHYVYYLMDAATGELLYIGRSNNPKHRRFAFMKRTGREVIFGISQRFADFARSQAAELKAIKEHRPPFNKHLVSSPGNLGSVALLGRKLTAEHKQKIGAASLGHPVTAEVRAAIAAKLLGHPVSEETRRKIGEKAKERAAARRAHNFGGFTGSATIIKTNSGSRIRQS